ncbi:MAG: hypothetical protein HYX43_17430 [Burkholderiales bacterium]|nr:hypothetical protein [Burkholderiales bacterium]
MAAKLGTAWEIPHIFGQNELLVCSGSGHLVTTPVYGVVDIHAPAKLLPNQFISDQMKFRILTTTGSEVVIAGVSRTSKPVVYGAPPETGLWRIDVPKFEDFLSNELNQLTFGDSVHEFAFGLEIAELNGWGPCFTKTRDYMSYRPKAKQFISVGQIEWQDVKGLAADAQLNRLKSALEDSIARIDRLARKPRDFDYARFGATVHNSLPLCTLAMVAA